MIVGSGIDLAEVARIQRSIERFGDRFLGRVYTPVERAYVDKRKNRFERYAARFAAKEAAMKAIGTGWNSGVTWRDIEVTNLPSGKPTLRFSGKAAEFVKRLGVRSVALSLSHTAELAIAEVILEN